MVTVSIQRAEPRNPTAEAAMVQLAFGQASTSAILVLAVLGLVRNFWDMLGPVFSRGNLSGELGKRSNTG